MSKLSINIALDFDTDRKTITSNVHAIANGKTKELIKLNTKSVPTGIGIEKYLEELITAIGTELGMRKEYKEFGS